MVNINKLKARVVENGMSIPELAKEMGLDKSTLYRKLRDDGAGLLVGEATQIISILKLSLSHVLARRKYLCSFFQSL